MTPREHKDARIRARAERAPALAAIIEEGKRARAEIAEQGRDAAALSRIQVTIQRRMASIDATHEPAVKARRLGALADWMSQPEIRAVIERGVHITRIRRWPHHPTKRVFVPVWVPVALAHVYREEASLSDEFHAAQVVRTLKAGPRA